VTAAAPDVGWATEELETVRRCPICDVERSTPLHSGLTDPTGAASGEWSLRRCSGCRAGYLTPRPRAAAIARAYEFEDYYTHGATEPAQVPTTITGRIRASLKHGYLRERYGYGLRPASRLGYHLGRAIPGLVGPSDAWVRHLAARPGARLLDVGCGNGVFVDRMCQLGWRAEGVDLDPRSVQRAQALGRSVRLASVEEVGQGPPRCYDAITMSHVIEHLYSPVEALEQLRRLLRPGGTLWIATPNVDSLGHNRFGPHWRGLEVPRHVALFSASSLLDRLRAAGFSELEVMRPMQSNRWMLEESARLEAAAESLPRPAAARIRRWCRVAHLRARRSPELSDELVVLAHAS
jgi:2-polyprenyl-3-methyl-5-hydroxy-6-metoxy-1,4-benzoquinol methylase